MSEDRAYTVHTDTLVGGEPTHRDGVVLACHPGRDQGVVSPQPLSVECTAEGNVVANWAWPSDTDGIRRITASGERFEVEGDLTYLSRWSRTSDRYSDELLSHTWDNAAPSAPYSIKARMIWAREGQPPIDGPWTVNQTTTCPPSFTPTNVKAECNSHGIVVVTWDEVNGADEYEIAGPFAWTGTATRVKWIGSEEGSAYTGIKTRARTGSTWGAWAGVPEDPECDPFEATPPDWLDGWASPNGFSPDPASHNPDLERPQIWENPDLYLASRTCGTRVPTMSDGEITGSSRRCDVTWAEVTPITLTAKHHDEESPGSNHGAQGHLHLRGGSVGSPYYASVAPHRHCDTETGLDYEDDAECGNISVDGEIVDGDIEIITWHPDLAAAGLTWWQQIILDTAVGAAAGGITAGLALKVIQIAQKTYRAIALSSGLSAVGSAGLGRALRTSDVKVNVMAPACLPSSEYHDGNSWIYQSRYTGITSSTSGQVPFKTRTDFESHVTNTYHTIDYCTDVIE